MTIKKRLAISNIIMIVVPVMTTLLAGLLCVCAFYLTLNYSNGFGFESNSEFYNVSREISGKMHEVFEDGPEATKTRLDTIGKIIDQDTMQILVYQNHADFYVRGNSDLAEKSLMQAAEEIGSTAFVSNEKRQLYYYTYQDSVGNWYELYLFSNNNHQDSNSIRLVAVLSALLLLLAVVGSIFMTNRFLIRFVFRKIEQPLNLLSNGVTEIRNGNLDYRMTYTRQDEFYPVCQSFNDMAERLKKSVEQSQKEEQNRKELLLDISHDLRSPLTVIQAYVEGLIDGVAESPERKQKYLETIKRKTMDIEKMVSSLLAYSKLDMEELTVQENVIFPSAFLKEATDSLREEYQEQGLSILLSPGDEAPVYADEELLLRILSNILDNSLKYKNCPCGQVKITTVTEGNFVKIELADNGPGVDESHLDKLFELFYRTDKARTNTGNGNGIGLAFVKKAVLAMGGYVDAKNNADGGLSILLYLRCTHDENTDY